MQILIEAASDLALSVASIGPLFISDFGGEAEAFCSFDWQGRLGYSAFSLHNFHPLPSWISTDEEIRLQLEQT
jgi:hypothetical protein